MKWQSGFLLKKNLAIVVGSLWFLSASSLLVSQSLKLFKFGDACKKGARPEIPASDPAPVMAVLTACMERAGPQDTLGVAYQDRDPNQQFLAYRLAYELYPRRVVPLPYDEGALEVAIHQLEAERHATLLLVFAGPGFAPPAGSRILARLPLNACLFYPAAPRNP
jgi:hypothetical protein